MAADAREFQISTIDYALERLNSGKSKRFLVADEVGLGKTIIARKIIERIIRDKNYSGIVFYVCSSLELAAQNLKKVRLDSKDYKKNQAIRLTTLPLEIDELQSSTKVVAITPGTSLDVGRNLGKKYERLFVHWIFNQCLGGRGISKGALGLFFRGQACRDSNHWNEELDWFEEEHQESLEKFFGSKTFAAIKKKLLSEVISLEDISDFLKNEMTNANSLIEQIRVIAPLLNRLESAVARKDDFKEAKSVRNKIVGKFRMILSEEVVKSDELLPSLVIFDEFQNFSNVLTGGDDRSKLARGLIERSRRSLFLSATPYKAPTTDWNLSESSHYDDFYAVLAMLGADNVKVEGGSHLDLIKRLFEERRMLLSQKDSLQKNRDSIHQNKLSIERLLKNYMVRTERDLFTKDQFGAVDISYAPNPWKDHREILDAYSSALNPQYYDVEYLKCFNFLRERGVLDAQKWYFSKEMWRSIPYPLSFMANDYQLMGHLQKPESKAALKELFASVPLAHEILTTDIKRLYGHSLANCPNPKLRQLLKCLEEERAGEALWVVPQKCYYQDKVPIARPEKRLVFSSWRVVPQAVSICASTFVEQMINVDAKKVEAERLNLTYTVSKGSRSDMSHTFLAFHPWAVLAKISVASGKRPSQSMDQLKNSIERELKKEGIQETRRGGSRKDRTIDLDEILSFLIKDEPKVLHHLKPNGLKGCELAKKKISQDTDEIDLSRDFEGQFRKLKRELGSKGQKRVFRLSRNEIDFLINLTIGGPGVCALRSLSGLFDYSVYRDEKIWRNKGLTEEGRFKVKTYENLFWFCHVELRSFFASTNSALVIKHWADKNIGKGHGDWDRVLRYSVAYHFQEMIDEYLFLLTSDYFEDQSGYKPDEKIFNSIKSVLIQAASALSVRAGRPKVRTWTKGGNETGEKVSVRRHYAQAFVESSGDSETTGIKLEHLRDAFNSPFWPFILTTTSVGQEGLDFHRYCKQVVHWNLPYSGVAFEQREGRIQRYLCKSVRDAILSHVNWDENLVKGKSALNPWISILKFANEMVQGKRDSLSGLRPYWSFKDINGKEAKIQRTIYCHPFSREAYQYERLKESLILYRLALGQPRQSDFLTTISEQLKNGENKDELLRLIKEFNLDLRP